MCCGRLVRTQVKVIMISSRKRKAVSIFSEDVTLYELSLLSWTRTEYVLSFGLGTGARAFGTPLRPEQMDR